MRKLVHWFQVYLRHNIQSDQLAQYRYNDGIVLVFFQGFRYRDIMQHTVPVLPSYPGRQQDIFHIILLCC